LNPSLSQPIAAASRILQMFLNIV